MSLARPAPVVLNDENDPALRNALDSPTVTRALVKLPAPSPAFPVLSPPPHTDGDCDVDSSPRTGGSGRLYLSQPTLLLDTLEALQSSSTGTDDDSHSESHSEDDASDDDPEAEAQRDLLEAESMLRYGLAKLSEISERHGRAVIEEHLRVFEHGPEDGICKLNKMLERACAVASRAPSSVDGESDTASEMATECVLLASPRGEGAAQREASEAVDADEIDATAAALSHVANEFAQKREAVNSVPARASPLAQDELAVLFSEVLLRNALAFLSKTERQLVDRVFAALAAAGEEEGSTGFELLNRLLDEARAHAQLNAARRTRAELEHDGRPAGARAEPPRAAAADDTTAPSPGAAGAADSAALDASDATGMDAAASEPLDPDESLRLLSLLSASDMAGAVVARVAAEFDHRLVRVADEAPVDAQLAQLLLAEALLKPSLGFLRNLSHAEMEAFWELGERLHLLEPQFENGCDFLSQLIREVGEAAEAGAKRVGVRVVAAPAHAPQSTLGADWATWGAQALVGGGAALALAACARLGLLSASARLFPSDAGGSAGFGFLEL